MGISTKGQVDLTSLDQTTDDCYMDEASVHQTAYQHALRVAHLQQLLQHQPKPNEASPASPVGAARRGSSATSGHALSASGSNWGSALFSLGDVFGKVSRSGEAVRFPKDLVKVLSARIDSIVKGSERTAAYRDDTFRSCVGAFYGNFHSASTQRQLKDNRKAEELIINFVTTAQHVLRKRAGVSEDWWKKELMNQVATFVRVLRECLSQTKHPPKELLERLDTYLSSLQRQPEEPTPSTAAAAAPNPLSSSRSSVHYLDAAPHTDLIKGVQHLFNVSDAQLSSDLKDIRKTCTLKGALRDLKTCMSEVTAGAPFPGRREDFDSDDSYANWRKYELDRLQMLVLQVVTVDKSSLRDTSADRPAPSSRPTSMMFSPNPSSTASSSAGRQSPSLHGRSPSVSSSVGKALEYFSASASSADTSATSQGQAKQSHDNESLAGTEILDDVGYTYIPPNARQVYQHILQLALAADIERLKHLDPDEHVSLLILSQTHLDLLEECAKWWRLTTRICAVLFLQEVGASFAADEIPLVQCVTEAMGDVDALGRAEGEDGDPGNPLGWDGWSMVERNTLTEALSELFDTLLRRIYECIQAAKSTDREHAGLLLDTLDLVYGNPVFREATAHDLPERFTELGNAVRIVAAHQYEKERTFLQLGQALANLSIVDGIDLVSQLQNLLKWIREAVQAVDKLFSKPILGEVDVPALYILACSPLYLEDLYSASQVIHNLVAHLPPAGATQDDVAAERENAVRLLFEAAREHLSMHNAYCTEEPLFIDFVCFEPYVHRWLASTDAKTRGWVQSAVEVDRFEPEGSDHHSSSIVDLIDSCKSAVAFVQDLAWPDPTGDAIFMTKLSATISKAIEQYCGTLEQIFLREMFESVGRADPEADERTSAWLVRAKGLYQTEKVEPFSFQEETLVKLNNIQAARDLLDKMYSDMDADKVSYLLEEQSIHANSSKQQDNNLFTVKVVLAEDLVRAGESSATVNPFLTLSDSSGERKAKTRTLYDTNSPRWAETFDLSVRGSLWLAATVYHRNLVEDHDSLGRALVHLDPRQYNDFLPKEVWLDLNQHGRVLLRISMEGEKDDIQFYFGRAFRSLKRTESDMVRIIVDKMSPMIRHFLSRNVLKSLLKKGGFSFDMETLKVVNDRIKDINLGKVKAMFGSSTNGGSEIPPVEFSEDESLKKGTQQEGKKKSAGLTDAEIEDAIGLLFEYFEDTFALLKGTLNDKSFHTVMSKIWKEILSVIEALLVPPLSAVPSEQRPLSDKEVYIVIRWLKGLSNFFYAGGEGMPIEDIQNPRFRELLALPLYYEMPTDDLMMECNRHLNGLLVTGAPTGVGRSITRSKSVLHQRNLGTIKEHKKGKRQDHKNAGSPEMMMRILRTRHSPGVQEFLTQQIETMSKIQQVNAQPPAPRKRLGAGKGKGAALASRRRLSALVSSKKIPPLPQAGFQEPSGAAPPPIVE